MKKRLLSAAVGLCILMVVLYFFDTLLVNAVFAVVGQIGIYEAVKAFSGRFRPGIYLLCSCYFVWYMFGNPGWIYPLFAFLFLLLTVSVLSPEKGSFRDAAAVFLVTVMLTYGLSAMLLMRNLSPDAGDRRMMFAFALGLGWVCDSLAFTVGRRLGKRRLAPVVSPNKTVEGAVGGVVGTAAVGAAAYAVYAALCPEQSVFFGKDQLPHILFFAAVSAVGAVAGMLGDLIFSYMKRESGIKDFGNVMPGHGGALDRIDSVLFTSVYASFVFAFFIKYF